MQIRRRKLSALCLTPLLFVVACSKSSETKTPSITNAKQASSNAKTALPPVDLNSPILAATMAPSVSEKGELVDPRFTFTQDEPQITVAVQVGKVTGAPLTIAWYQTAAGGDQKLFEHQVKVNEYERAYSIGRNPGTLSAGSYTAKVTLDGHAREVPFDIVPKASPQRPPPPGATGGASQPTPPPEPAPGKPPISGGSGAVPGPLKSEHTGNQSAATTCKLQMIPLPGNPDPDSDSVKVLVQIVLCPHEVTPPRVKAAIGNNTARELSAVGGWDHAEGGTGLSAAFTYGRFDVRPCDLEGGSDLPRATVTMTATEGNPPLTGSVVITLGEDTIAPRITMYPTNGTKVHPGEDIIIDVTATEYSNGGPWQTGLRRFKIVDRSQPTEHKLNEWTNPSPNELPCTSKAADHAKSITYKVGKEPIIRICALAQDYKNPPTVTCHEFPNGDPYHGTWQYESSRLYTGDGRLCSDAWDGTLSFVVGPDGTLVGDASATLGRASCTLPGFPPPPSRIFSLSGRQTAVGDFELRFKSAGPPDPGADLANGNLLLAGSSSQCFHTPTPTVILRRQANGTAAGTLELKETPFMACSHIQDHVMTLKARFEVKREPSVQNVSEKPAGVDTGGPPAEAAALLGSIARVMSVSSDDKVGHVIPPHR